MAFKQHRPMRNRESASDDSVQIYRVKSSNHKYIQLGIAIGSGLMRRLRWVVGDRIQVFFGEGEDDGYVLVKRAVAGSDGSYALSGGGGSTSANKKGKNGRGEVKITPTPEILENIFQGRDSVNRFEVESTIDDEGALLLAYK